MPFLGKSPTAGFASIVKDDLTPNGSTTAFTLSKQVANANDIAVFLGNVRQEPTDAYTVSGTTLTMSEAPASGLNFYVLHIAGTIESSVVPADGTISSAKIATNAVTDAKIASGITASKLTGALPAIDGASLSNVVPDTIFTHAYLGGLQTLTNDTVTKINYNTQGPYNGLQWDTSNYKVTFDSTNAGKYLVSFGVAAFSGTNTFRELGLRPYKNGSQIREILTLVNGTSGGTNLGVVRHVLGHYTMILDFNDTDYFEVYAQFEVGSGNADAHSSNYGSEIFLTRIGD